MPQLKLGNFRVIVPNFLELRVQRKIRRITNTIASILRENMPGYFSADIYYMQWRIQGRGPGTPSPPPLFWVKQNRRRKKSRQGKHKNPLNWNNDGEVNLWRTSLSERHYNALQKIHLFSVHIKIWTFWKNDFEFESHLFVIIQVQIEIQYISFHLSCLWKMRNATMYKNIFLPQGKKVW